jgi:hypothetical protein
MGCDPNMGQGPCLFVARSRREVPQGLTRYACVDGTVPGATFVWDHHTSGESTNLDVIPERFDPRQLDGIASTHVDTDAVLSAVCVLLGGRAALDPDTRAVFETACHFCDHLRPHPDHDAETQRRGRFLHTALMHDLQPIEGRSERFATEVCRVLACLNEGRPLPQRDPDDDVDPELIAALKEPSRIQRFGDVAVVDTKGLSRVDALTVYDAHRAKVGVNVSHHHDGGFIYVVGRNPLIDAAPSDLTPLLARVAEREHAYGPPTTHPAPGHGNWGGRAEVFGSPWGYGSRIAPEELGRLLDEGLRELDQLASARPESG